MTEFCLFLFGELSHGKKFQTQNGFQWMKIPPVVDMFKDEQYNAVALDGSGLEWFDLQDEVYVEEKK